MRVWGERGAARARALVESFRPLPVAVDFPRIVLTGFGAFDNVSRNATESMIRALASQLGIAMRLRSFRARELAMGRGVVRLSSGFAVHVSLMVLPVVWEAAGALVAKEARASRASLVVMSGVSGRGRSLTVESFATTALVRRADVFGVRPARRSGAAKWIESSLDVDVARAAAESALSRESVDAISGAVAGVLDGDNSYVCNQTAHLAARTVSGRVRVLRSSARPRGIEIARIGRVAHGFVHWPRAIPSEDAPACARVLLEMVDALISAKRAGAAA